MTNGRTFKLELTFDEAMFLQSLALYAHAKLIPPPNIIEELKNAYIITREQHILNTPREVRLGFTAKMRTLSEEMGV